MIGWQAIADLAEALFEIRKLSALNENRVRLLITLWNKLPEHLKNSKVDYPPRYRQDSAQTGRFMQKKTASKSQTVTPGLVSLRR